MNLTINTPLIDKKQNSYVTATTKTASAAGAIAGVGIALTAISRKRGLKVPSSFKDPKKVVDIFKKMEIKEADAIKIASASIGGGLLGGSLTDSKNIKAKTKEGIVQLVGNYIIPTIFVGMGIKLNKLLNNKFKFPPVTKAIQFGFGFTSLIAGVVAGNRVSREINKNVFKENAYRKLSWKDWILQGDNVCLVTSVSNSGTNTAKIASRFIPAVNIIPGYLVGIKQK